MSEMTQSSGVEAPRTPPSSPQVTAERTAENGGSNNSKSASCSSSNSTAARERAKEIRTSTAKLLSEARHHYDPLLLHSALESPSPLSKARNHVRRVVDFQHTSPVRSGRGAGAGGSEGAAAADDSAGAAGVNTSSSSMTGMATTTADGHPVSSTQKAAKTAATIQRQQMVLQSQQLASTYAENLRRKEVQLALSERALFAVEQKLSILSTNMATKEAMFVQGHDASLETKARLRDVQRLLEEERRLTMEAQARSVASEEALLHAQAHLQRKDQASADRASEYASRMEQLTHTVSSLTDALKERDEVEAAQQQQFEEERAQWRLMVNELREALHADHTLMSLRATMAAPPTASGARSLLEIEQPPTGRHPQNSDRPELLEMLRRDNQNGDDDAASKAEEIVRLQCELDQVRNEKESLRQHNERLRSELEATMVQCQAASWDASSLSMENMSLRGLLELRPLATASSAAQQVEQLLAQGRWRSDQKHCTVQTTMLGADVEHQATQLSHLRMVHDVLEAEHVVLQGELEETRAKVSTMTTLLAQRGGEPARTVPTAGGEKDLSPISVRGPVSSSQEVETMKSTIASLEDSLHVAQLGHQKLEKELSLARETSNRTESRVAEMAAMIASLQSLLEIAQQQQQQQQREEEQPSTALTLDATVEPEGGSGPQDNSKDSASPNNNNSNKAVMQKCCTLHANRAVDAEMKLKLSQVMLTDTQSQLEGERALRLTAENTVAILQQEVASKDEALSLLRDCRDREAQVESMSRNAVEHEQASIMLLLRELVPDGVCTPQSTSDELTIALRCHVADLHARLDKASTLQRCSERKLKELLDGVRLSLTGGFASAGAADPNEEQLHQQMSHEALIDGAEFETTLRPSSSSILAEGNQHPPRAEALDEANSNYGANDVRTVEAQFDSVLDAVESLKLRVQDLRIETAELKKALFDARTAFLAETAAREETEQRFASIFTLKRIISQPPSPAASLPHPPLPPNASSTPHAEVFVLDSLADSNSERGFTDPCDPWQFLEAPVQEGLAGTAETRRQLIAMLQAENVPRGMPHVEKVFLSLEAIEASFRKSLEALDMFSIGDEVSSQ